MGLFRKLGRLIGSGARIGLGFATGGPTGAGAAAIREISRGRARRSRRRTRRQRFDPRLGPMFQPRPAPLVPVDRRGRGITTDLAAALLDPTRVTGPGGTRKGVDLTGAKIAQAPLMRTCVAHRPGFVTVTLPWQAFGFAAGAKVQMIREIAIKLGLHKRTRKPLLSAGDLDALRKADRVSRKLVGLTSKHTDFKCVSKGTRGRASTRKR